MPQATYSFDAAEQKRKAEALRRMHDRSGVLVLPNAWDALSARLFENAGFPAVATTSGGVAWALGYPDGEGAPRDEIIAATGRIARAVNVPVTADLESGFGATPAAVAETITAVIQAGAVGVNLEDGTHRPDQPLRSIEEAAARIRAARAAADAAGVPIVINARSDVYFHLPGDAQERFSEAVRRARAYFASGADCFFPIGLGDLQALAALVSELDAPVNATIRPGGATVADLQRAGVARVSTATALTTATMGLAQRLAQQLFETGTFQPPVPPLSHGEAQALFSARRV